MDRDIRRGKDALRSPLVHMPLKFASLLLALMALSLLNVRGAHADCSALMTGAALSTCVSPTGNSNKPVRIGSGNCTGKAYYVDQSFVNLGDITIEKGATLSFPNSGNLSLQTTNIFINGTLQVGNSSCPIGSGTGNSGNTVTIQLTGVRPDKLPVVPDCKNRDGEASRFDKGILVCQDGTLNMYGAKGVPPNGVNWTTLLKPAGDPTLYGAGKGLGAPVTEPDARTIHVTDNVIDATSGWKQGDWIAIATTSYSPFETEIVQLAAAPQVDSINGGYLLTLVQPLQYYHFGGLAPSSADTSNPACKNSAGTVMPAFFCDPASKNFGVDERAEVGLLSRNIKLTSSTLPFWMANNSYSTSSAIQVRNGAQVYQFSTTAGGTSGSQQPASWPTGIGATVCDNGTGTTCTGGVLWANAGLFDQAWGGETRVLHGFAAVNIQGVEIAGYGKDSLGSYPIHFHQDGILNTSPLVDSNSIHHSYNKCVTVHSTTNLNITNNVCVRADGHLFYEEIGDEDKITFQDNLGLGATSNNFGISPASAIPAYWWSGDNLAYSLGYDGLNVPDVDSQANPAHGSCMVPNRNGGEDLINATGYPKENTKCTAEQLYTEPASGFWIVNPTTNMIGNSIGGCQGVGIGYWYVPPPSGRLPFVPVGTFLNNSAHACYDGFFGEAFNTWTGQLHPLQVGLGGDQTNAIIATFNGLTATRNRYLGAWIRPDWFVFNNARLATNRDDISIVTAGGADGSAPGVWSMLANSVVVGVSQNNVDRFGPCPDVNSAYPAGGGKRGCIDQTPAAFDQIGLGYPDPTFNFNGFFIYDGPPRIVDDHFVNFKVNITPLLTTADNTFLTNYSSSHGGFIYEGDAALGWFKNNQSAYPATTTTEGLLFTNVDFRHQIFTELVNLGNFDDGDKNTVIVDRDGSLTGFSVVDTNNNLIPGEYPISLNNLPFNVASNAVDECHATGAQNAALEGRPTSLISAGQVGTLELQALWPEKGFDPPPAGNVPPLDERYEQWITFTKDTVDYPKLYPDQHWSMDLHGRNNNGVWEPKVQNGYGYTISVPKTIDAHKTNQDIAGIPKVVDIGLTDAHISPTQNNHTFYVRVSLVYNGVNGPPAKLKITRGFRSWGSPTGILSPPFFNDALGQYWMQTGCWNLDTQQPLYKDCPGKGFQLPTTVDKKTTCPKPTDPNLKVTLETVTDRTDPLRQKQLCVFQPFDLTASSDLSTVTPGSDTYYYDNGILTFYVRQDDLNAEGPSPMGECVTPTKQTGCSATCPTFQNPAPDCSCSNFNPCPDVADGEAYYACPVEGCVDYRVRVEDPNYQPAAINCSANPALCTSANLMDPPTDENLLTVATDPLPATPFTRLEQNSEQGLPHAIPSGSPTPSCPITTIGGP